MKTPQLLSTVSLFALLAFAIGHSLGAPAPDPASDAVSPSASAAPFDLTDTARIQAGKTRFNSTCAAYCHGAEGGGGKTPPFKGNQDFSASRAFKIITEGRRGSDVMPPWGKAFTEEQIWELVAYLDYLSKQPASR